MSEQKLGIGVVRGRWGRPRAARTKCTRPATRIPAGSGGRDDFDRKVENSRTGCRTLTGRLPLLRILRAPRWPVRGFVRANQVDLPLKEGEHRQTFTVAADPSTWMLMEATLLP